MAEGYAHASGRPGVCMVTSGPGATNIVTPLADAYIDSIPMVAITGQVSRAGIGTDAFQEVDITGITMPVTKHNWLIRRAADIPTVIKEAFHIATTGRPGPVLVDVPKDVLTETMEWFWPDDVDVTLAYVAPISFAAPDYRYEPYLEGIGPADCKASLRAVQAEMLTNRRAALQTRASAEATQEGRSYTRITLPAAVESAVVSLEWAFWQYVGAGSCASIPPVTASDDTLFAFLQAVSEVGGSDDANLAEFEAYYYQAEVELGYPGTMDEHLTGLLAFPPEAYDGAYPPGVTRPPYAPAAMDDVAAWVTSAGERIVFLYGEWDPWSGGMFDPGAGPEVLRVVAPGAPHGAGVGDLTAGDRAAVLAKVQQWTGLVADEAALARTAPAPAMPRPPRPPRLPPPIAPR